MKSKILGYKHVPQISTGVILTGMTDAWLLLSFTQQHFRTVMGLQD